MELNVKSICKDYDFCICGASYVGCPQNNTVMYISKKVEKLVANLYNCSQCLVFAENGIDIDFELKEKHCFVFTENPQYEYAEVATRIAAAIMKEEEDWGYTVTDGGYYIGHNVSIGKDCHIEPGVLLGHNVKIGDNAIILSGAKITHAVIGSNFYCNENAVIGANGFTMATDLDGNKMRIPSLGKVVIKDNVEVGTNDNISRGSAMDTVIEDNVKLDTMVHIGHDAHINKNTEIVAGSVIGGYDVVGENVFIGINASLRNRISVEDNVVIGMGAVVTKSIGDRTTVIGNPARSMKKCE